MKPYSWRFLSLIALAVLLPALVAVDAQADRRSGLAGNLLITDADDVFIFPQLNTVYSDRLIVDMGTSGTSGSGTLIFGNESWAINFSTHRSDFLNGVVAGFWSGNDRGLFGPQFSPDLSGPSDQSPSDFQWFDIGFAAGNETKWGVRWGSGLDVANAEQSGGQNIENSAHANSIQGGVTINETTDIAAEISFANSTLADTSTSLEGNAKQFAAGIRGFYEMGGFNWGYLGSLGFSTDETDEIVGAGTETAKDSIKQFMVGWGPVWNDQADEWQVAGYATFEYQAISVEPTGTAPDVDARAVTFPGFRFAGEHRLKNWLWVRGGVHSDYFFQKVEVADPAGTIQVFDREYDFQWTAGVSLDWGSFRFDGAINEPWVTNGPQFLGSDSDLFAFASATYNWGGGKSE